MTSVVEPDRMVFEKKLKNEQFTDGNMDRQMMDKRHQVVKKSLTLAFRSRSINSLSSYELKSYTKLSIPCTIQ